MPWPFRKRKDAAGASAPSSSMAAPGAVAAGATAPGRPFTAADFAPRRIAVPRPRAWATLPPMQPSIAPASHGLVVPAASFVSEVAGTQQLLQVPLLRQVSGDAPGGRADAIVAPNRPLPVAPADPGPAGPGSAEAREPRSRPLSGRPARSGTGRLDTYQGPLQPVAPERYDEGGWDTGWYDDEPEPVDDESAIREELPPPIFSALLAERTGVPLSELRPDLAGTETEPAEPPPPPSRRRSLAESRRMGLGAPQHSPAAEGEGPPELPEDFDPAAARPARAAGPEPEPAPDDDEGELEVVEEIVTIDDLVAARPFILPEGFEPLPEPPDVRPEPEPPHTPPAEPRPTLRFRSAPGAPVRRFPSEGGIPVRQPVPPDVRHAVEHATGVDPGPSEIRRGPEASAQATRIGAVAFTREGEIFLPAEHGPLDAPQTRAVLAHELTHVVQHRVYGGRLPRRESPAGRALEAEARGVQRWVGGTGRSPRREPRQQTADERRLRDTAQAAVASGLAHWAADGTLVFGGGTVAGGEDWMVNVSDDRDEADARLRELEDQVEAAEARGSGREDAERELSEYRTEYRRTFPIGAGSGESAGGGATGGGSAASLQEQRRALDAEHRLASGMSYGAMSSELFGGSFFGDPRGEDTKATSYADLSLGGFWDDPTAPQSDADYEKARKKILENMEKARTGGTATTPTTGGAGGAQPLVHAPGGGGRTTTPPVPTLTSSSPTSTAGGSGGDVTAAAEKVIAEKKAAVEKVKTESERLQEEMKNQQQMWKMQDELEKLDYEHSLTQDRSYGDFAAGFVGGAFSGGVGGFFSALGGDLFGDSREAEEKAAYEQQRERLTKQIEMQQAVERAQAAEKAQAAEEKAAKAKEAADKKTTEAKPGADLAKAAETAAVAAPAAAALSQAAADADMERAARDAVHSRGIGMAESEGAGNALIAQLADEDVEELASLLYGRLVTRLRRELIVDRERAGLLTDFR